MWKPWKKKEEKKEKKKLENEEDLLKELCENDPELYDFLARSLYLDPMAAISKTGLKILVEEAEKSVKDEDYREAMQKYETAMDKAIFEATQNPKERERYIKLIQDLASKIAKVTEKAKEKGEKEGFASPALEGRIERYHFMSERIEEVMRVASLFYNERLEKLGAMERREARTRERAEAEREEEREEKEAKERREARTKDMGREERKEAEREEKKIAERERERREERREERKEAEREEKKIAEREKETREARRKGKLRNLNNLDKTHTLSIF